jgi:glycosyltransferase involved in cell wall biosynthesis
LIYNGVDLERFTPGEEPALSQELSIPEDATVIGYIGEIRRERNLDVLVEAAAALRRREAEGEGARPHLHLVMVGDHSLEPKEPERLERLASRLGMEGRLHFTGYRRDPERFYRIFTVYALPSTREGFGVTLIEAMASEVPVVACRVRGPRDIIDDGLDGILVADRDSSELADAVSFLLETPEAVRAYTERAREKVARDFNHKRMRSQLLNEYHRLT